MKKIIILSILILFLYSFSSAETRTKPTVTAYSSDQIVKRGDVTIYWIDYVVTTNGGGFTIYDALTSSLESDVKTEGSQATAKNGGHIDFTHKPLELSTGLYLDVLNCKVVIAYD